MSSRVVFRSMPDLIPEGKIGTASVEHFTIAEPSARMLIRPDEYIPPGRYARLLVNNRIMMSDTPFERRTNSHMLWNSHGHVLIGGLGLGMLIFPILSKEPRIESLTVVEKNHDVYDLILPHLPDDPRLAVFEGDIHTWEPHKPFYKADKFNVIYFDIWGEYSTDTLEEMTSLKRRYRKWLNKEDPAKYIGCWQEEYLRDSRRSESRRYGAAWR